MQNEWITSVDDLEGMDLADVMAAEDGEQSERFHIADDDCADWAVRKIAEARAELTRMQAMAADQIARIEQKVAAAQKRYENETAFLTDKLSEYFNTVPHKATKTQETYRLLSGTLKRKLGGVSMKQDDEKLLAYLKASGNSDMVQTKESPRWGEFKKRLEIVGAAVIDRETGEIVEGVEIVTKPDTFTIEV